jgi:Ca-activated chloride channel family protein
MTSYFPDLATLQHFHLMRPYWLLIFIPILLIFRSLSKRDDTLGVWRSLMSPEILKHLTVSGSSNHLLSPKKVSWLLGILACIVLVGPSWTQKSSPFTEDKSVLIIALDVSKTMEQSDIQPSRLLRAKQKIIELLAIRGDANTALIAYSGSAHVVMPITNDSEMIRHFLDALDRKIMPNEGKIPQTVLPLAENLFKATQVPGTLLLLGDGASNDTVQQFSRYFANNSHQLVVWGIGNSEPTKDKDSNIIPMQLTQLEALADESNGRLVTLTHDKQDIDNVFRYIENNLVIVDDESRPWHDSSYPLVFLIAALYLLWFRKGWTLQW